MRLLLLYFSSLLRIPVTDTTIAVRRPIKVSVFQYLVFQNIYSSTLWTPCPFFLIYISLFSFTSPVYIFFTTYLPFWNLIQGREPTKSARLWVVSSFCSPRVGIKRQWEKKWGPFLQFNPRRVTFIYFALHWTVCLLSSVMVCLVVVACSVLGVPRCLVLCSGMKPQQSNWRHKR